jgi:hypothetical protein
MPLLTSQCHVHTLELAEKTQSTSALTQILPDHLVVLDHLVKGALPPTLHDRLVKGVVAREGHATPVDPLGSIVACRASL